MGSRVPVDTDRRCYVFGRGMEVSYQVVQFIHSNGAINRGGTNMEGLAGIDTTQYRG